MDLAQIVSTSLNNTQASLWPWFAPEIALSVTIMVLLLARLFALGRWIGPHALATIGAATALYFVVAQTTEAPGELFTGMLVVDGFAIFVRALLMLFVVLLVALTWITKVPDRFDATDFLTLVLGSTVGLCLMATANHLLMVFMAVEMASVPSYAMAASQRGKRLASEAGLKYAVYGAGAAGVMLYGISLLAGLTNSAHLPSIAAELAKDLPTMVPSEKMVLVLSALMILAGLSFKLSAFPFHFWCPDVFEGATAEVDAFLSVASKAAALALLVRISVGLSCPVDRSTEPPAAQAIESGSLFDVGEETAEDGTALHATTAQRDAMKNLAPVRRFIAILLAVVAAVTCTFGNLAAYGQTNLKRLLAYSTIAHAGYMILAVPAALEYFSVDRSGSARAIGALGIYIGVYLFMNLGAFAVVAYLRDSQGSEEIADFAGIVQRSPVLVVCFGIMLFSLVGLPPLAGFVGKFAIFASLTEAFQETGAVYLLVLLVVGGLNTAISLFYYLRVMKVMAIDPLPDRGQVSESSMVSLSGAYLVLITLPLLLLFVAWQPLSRWATAAAAQLF